MNPESTQSAQPVSGGELNAWRRGFTPQAEIWNGRMAMCGLAIGMSIVFFSRFLLAN